MGLLDDESIWRGKIFTGEWTSTGHTTQATEPATGKVLGEVGTASAEVLSRCAEQAADAGRRWAQRRFRSGPPCCAAPRCCSNSTATRSPAG